MTRRLTMTLTAALGVLAACAEPPTAPMIKGLEASLTRGGPAYLPGEQQPIALPLTGSWAIYPEGVGQNLSQTFTPTENGWLGYLELPVGCEAGVVLNMKIRDGLGGAILYEANRAGLPQIVDGAFQLSQVYDPALSAHGIKLHKDHTYAFELAAFPAGTCGLAKGPAGNSYSGGQGYYRDLTYSATWLPLPNGAPTDDEDLPFITLVR